MREQTCHIKEGEQYSQLEGANLHTCCKLPYYWNVCWTPKLRIKYTWGFMHEFWTISTANMTYTRLQNYIDMVVGEHEIQTFNVGDTIMLFTLSIEQDKQNW